LNRASPERNIEKPAKKRDALNSYVIVIVPFSSTIEREREVSPSPDK